MMRLRLSCFSCFATQDAPRIRREEGKRTDEGGSIRHPIRRYSRDSCSNSGADDRQWLLFVHQIQHLQRHGCHEGGCRCQSGGFVGAQDEARAKLFVITTESNVKNVPCAHEDRHRAVHDLRSLSQIQGGAVADIRSANLLPNDRR